MRASTLLVSLWMAACLAACAPTVYARGTPQPFDSACDGPNEGQQIAVDGYLRLPPSLDRADRVVLGLYRDRTYAGRPIGVMMRFGDGPNQAHKIASSYRDQDLRVHVVDGREVAFGTRLRVSGRVSFPARPADYDCLLMDPYVEEAR